VAVVPARGCHFFTYDSAKELYAWQLNSRRKGHSNVHLLATVTAMLATAAAAANLA
jgi:hypothetical protein